MKKRRIVMIWVGMAIVSALSLAAMAEPAQDAPRERGTEPDKVAREAREISRWLIEHPQMAERILLNLRKQRAEGAAAAPRRPDKAEAANQPGRGYGRWMDRPEREEKGRLPQPQREGFARRFKRDAEAGKPVRRGPVERDAEAGKPVRRGPDQEITQRLDRLEAMVKKLAEQIKNLREGETPQREGRTFRR